MTIGGYPKPGSAPVRTILVVEDETELRQELVELIEALGCACHGAADLGQAFEIVGRELIDAVLCDFKLGGESGLDLLRHLRCSASSSLAPRRLILMTGHTELTDSAYSAIETYADALILKPISIAALGEQIGISSGGAEH